MDAHLIPVFIVGGMPTAIVAIVSYFRYKTRALAVRPQAANEELTAFRDERKQLEARIQNLESIVCSVDLELNARLAALGAAGARPSEDPPADRLAARPDARQTPPLPSTVASLAAAAPAGLQPGARVAGRYTVERELGRGGMVAVYLARDEQLGERVALKVIASMMATDPAAATERFRREVAAARKVTHPNVIRIHDLIEDGPHILLSMEYVEGITLAAYLGRKGALPLEEARFVLGQVCEGLAAAHAVGVVHRDLKPGNVLLDLQRRVKLIDFGLAKASFLAGMTATGLILGTPEYMAPEQVRGLPCDTRTDLYAVGALAYHLLTGRPPFSGDTPIAVGFAQVTEPPRPPRELRPELPAPLEAAILRALAKDRADRFLDALELKHALGA